MAPLTSASFQRNSLLATDETKTRTRLAMHQPKPLAAQAEKSTTLARTISSGRQLPASARFLRGRETEQAEQRAQARAEDAEQRAGNSPAPCGRRVPSA